MLKLDLLPAHYAVARRNRKTIFLSIPLLVGVMLLWLLVMVKMDSTIAATKQELEETTAAANAVRDLQSATEARKAELKPIQDKVDFVMAADKCGQQYWDRFYEINKYIFDRALVTRFSLTPPSAVAFDVEVETTEDAGRFILNLIRCPTITSISISGQPVSGGNIAGVSGTTAVPTAGGAAPGGPGMPGGEMGPGMPGGPPGAPGGMPGGPPGGAPGGAPSVGGAAGPIRFSVTAQLVQPLTVPTPPAAGGAAAAGPAGPGGPGGPPGAGPPGAGPGGPPGEGPKGKGGDDEDSGSKPGEKGGDDGGGGDE